MMWVHYDKMCNFTFVAPIDGSYSIQPAVANVRLPVLRL